VKKDKNSKFNKRSQTKNLGIHKNNIPQSGFLKRSSPFSEKGGD